MRYTIEQKKEIVKEYLNGEKCKNLMEKYKICKATLYLWINLFKVQKKRSTRIAYTYHEYLETKRKLAMKTLEYNILQDAHCFKDSSLKEKEMAVERLMDKYPVRVMCRVLGLNHSTFMNYHYRRKIVTSYDLHYEELKKEIVREFNKSRGRFTHNQIYAKLKNRKISCSVETIMRLMNELGLEGQRTQKQPKQKPSNSSIFYSNILKRNFVQHEPNKAWCGDITYINVNGINFYLCVVMDIFSRKIIAHKLSSRNDTYLTINTFKQAFESRNRPKDLIFHSDQGSNYTSNEFGALLHTLKVEQSLSKRGNPYDNAVIESFFSNFKQEEIYSRQYEFFDEVEESINEYMKYYNNYRPHTNLNYKTPNEFEKEYYQNLNKENRQSN